MFRTIRRKEKSLEEKEIKELLKESRYGILSLVGLETYPYAIPINYYYDEEQSKIYFHGAKNGHKAEALKLNHKVCFTIVGKEEINDEEWAPYTKSVLVFGQCHLIKDEGETLKRIRKLASKYYPDSTLIEKEINKSIKALNMYEITIDHLSGKWVQEK